LDKNSIKIKVKAASSEAAFACVFCAAALGERAGDLRKDILDVSVGRAYFDELWHREFPQARLAAFTFFGAQRKCIEECSHERAELCK
jgi:hypothetical protein